MKDKLLVLIEVGRAREAETIVPLVDDSEPSAPGKWTAKDHLAHLSVWREVAVTEVDSALRGTPAPEMSGGTDELNAGIYAETHGLSAKEVVARAARSWTDLASLIDGCTEAQLQSPRPRHPGEQLWEAVPGNSFSHVGEHLGFLAAEKGDEAGSEEAAHWSYEQLLALPSDAARASGLYNFGCFFARRGRAAEALPYLRESIQIRPDLREWAKTDSDLDPIRTAPEVASLLEG
jgi:hypothetical protein